MNGLEELEVLAYYVREEEISCKEIKCNTTLFKITKIPKKLIIAVQEI